MSSHFSFQSCLSIVVSGCLVVVRLRDDSHERQTKRLLLFRGKSLCPHLHHLVTRNVLIGEEISLRVEILWDYSVSSCELSFAAVKAVVITFQLSLSIPLFFMSLSSPPMLSPPTSISSLTIILTKTARLIHSFPMM